MRRRAAPFPATTRSRLLSPVLLDVKLLDVKRIDVRLLDRESWPERHDLENAVERWNLAVSTR
jgi:hypothetical protein